MKKKEPKQHIIEKAHDHIKKNLTEEEILIGFFFAQKFFSLWQGLLLGAAATAFIKRYFVGVSNRGIHFYKLHPVTNGFEEHDFFDYSEITNVKIGKGYLQVPIEFLFNNGRKFKIRAQQKAFGRVAPLTEEVQKEIEKNIQTR